MSGVRKSKRGGRKPGAGRPAGPPEAVRRNRVTLFLRDDEAAELAELAEDEGLPLATVAYQLFADALRRAKKSR